MLRRPSPSNSKNGKGSFKAVWLIGCKEGKFYIITGFLDHVTNSEFVNWYYHIDKYVNERTQVYRFIENNTLQDPFYEQVFFTFVYKCRKAKRKVHSY